MGPFTFARSLIVLTLLACSAFSQQTTKFFTQQVSAVGPAPSQFVDARYHTVQLYVVSPTTCTIRLEGSLDNVHWADISGTQPCTPASALMFHVPDRGVSYVRVNLLTYAGDAGNATVGVIYKGWVIR